MKQEEVDYQAVIDLGFKVGYMDDEVHQKQYGYDDFWVNLKINKRFEVSWCNKTRFLEMQRMKKDRDNEGSIEERIPLENLADLKRILFIFGKITKEDYEESLPKEGWGAYHTAC